ncbi:MAG: hypothetical protein AB7R89_33305 [Dehalococcoidia bacterium]
MYRIVFQEPTAPIAGKLADAEIHFTAGDMAGLKLIGFAVWERRAGGRNVTFPARQYAVNGERRSYALLRPTTSTDQQQPLRDAIISAYATYERQQTAPAGWQTIDTSTDSTPL